MAEKSNPKSRYWSAILYPESMIPNWEDELDQILGKPYAYCVHDKDVDERGDPRKVHIHFLLAYSNTTTYNNVLNLFNELGVCNTVQVVRNVRSAYDYLIHDTERARKAGKYLYPKEARVLGNDFDIGKFEQISERDKIEMVWQIHDLIAEKGFTNFHQLTSYVRDNMDIKYQQALMSRASFLALAVRGYYHEVLNPALSKEERDMAKAEMEEDAFLAQYVDDDSEEDDF